MLAVDHGTPINGISIQTPIASLDHDDAESADWRNANATTFRIEGPHV
jgi:hypothetical protein